MEITQLYIYPIKSLAGISLKSAELLPKGLKYDRRWLLVDENGIHVTQRTEPVLVLFKTSILEEGIGVTYEGEEVLIPFKPKNSKTATVVVDVWGDQFEAEEVSVELSDWFSKKVGKELKLVHQPEDVFRQIDQKYANSPTDDVSAADGYPILIISEESLADLNERLEETVEMLRFRPNLVISGLPAYGEDMLTLIKTPTVTLLGVKNCGRCIMVTNDLNKGKLSKEPLKTLSTYRKDGSKVLFGRNFIPQSLGLIKVGDKIIEV
ncbi:hypothetical protein SAMN06298216_3820 [Spirosomataceae bacterium TFI 002]|nr:hypothetical protein SAMN06298216_3820 [Spirosomataceae bacterium TFI 002]